jgi:hypothetical protein
MELVRKFLTLIQSYLRERYQKVLNDKINAYDSVSSGRKKLQPEFLRVPAWVLDFFLFIIMSYTK